MPQALRAVYPSLGNQFIQTVLASSIGIGYRRAGAHATDQLH